MAEHRVLSCHIAVSADDMAVTTATCTASCRTPTASAEPPGGFRSKTKREPKRPTGDANFTKTLDSLVGSSTLLGTLHAQSLGLEFQGGPPQYEQCNQNR